MDIIPFKNILNDLSSWDISKKVLAGWMTPLPAGKVFRGPLRPMRVPADHGHLIIGPEPAVQSQVGFQFGIEWLKYDEDCQVSVVGAKNPYCPHQDPCGI